MSVCVLEGAVTQGVEALKQEVYGLCCVFGEVRVSLITILAWRGN